MADEKAPAVDNDASAWPTDERLPGELETHSPCQRTIARLLLQIDKEAEQSRLIVAGLVEQIKVLTLAAGKGDAAGGDRNRQLRDANERLVLAALGAQDLQAKAEASSRRQEEFLSMLAHELRNPLAPIAMATELLGQRLSADPQLMKFQGIISRQVKHMVQLVDNLMDASRVSSGKIVLQKNYLLLSDAIDSALETSKPFIDKRGHRLSIDLPDAPIYLEGDLVRLAQVFSNLLINAAKFTPDNGDIAMAAVLDGEYVDVTVRDDGEGIEASLQPIIFDLFTQGTRSLERSQGGLGIGLSLVRTLTEMHGGTVAVRSAGVGYGSEFIVRLRITSAQNATAISPPLFHAVPLSRRILLIEDNLDASVTLTDFLATEGHVITPAFTGTAGLALAMENSYDVVICDIGLPGMDGYEVIRQLRLHSGKPGPVCIALSGYSQVENRNRATAAGFDHYLVKPVPIDQLGKLLALRRPG